MDNHKKLAYAIDKHTCSPWPQVRYEDISEQERCRLRCKHLYEVDQTDLEAWLAIDLEDNKWEYEYSISEEGELFEEQSILASPQSLEAHLRYLRAEYRHANHFTQWRKEGLDPLVKDLTTMAKEDPQFDWYYLYKLERQKLICMEAYLSHSRIADEESNYEGKRWLCLCIQLLGYILDGGSITPDQFRQLNIKNSINLIPVYSREELLGADQCRDDVEDYTTKNYFLRKLYQRKAERLYYRIRLEYTRMWWD